MYIYDSNGVHSPCSMARLLFPALLLSVSAVVGDLPPGRWTGFEYANGTFACRFGRVSGLDDPASRTTCYRPEDDVPLTSFGDGSPRRDGDNETVTFDSRIKGCIVCRYLPTRPPGRPIFCVSCRDTVSPALRPWISTGSDGEGPVFLAGHAAIAENVTVFTCAFEMSSVVGSSSPRGAWMRHCRRRKTCDDGSPEFVQRPVRVKADVAQISLRERGRRVARECRVCVLKSGDGSVAVGRACVVDVVDEFRPSVWWTDLMVRVSVIGMWLSIVALIGGLVCTYAPHTIAKIRNACRRVSTKSHG